MHNSPGDSRPASGLRSAQHPVRRRENAPSLHDYIQPLRIDNQDRRSLRARAKFTWNLTDKWHDIPDCRFAAWICSPISWTLSGLYKAGPDPH